MKIEELIKKYEYLNHDCFRRVDTSQVLRDLKQLDEPETGHADEAPRYVKNILARLRELPLHDREVWLKVIISEFKQDFSRAKWREGYEQGKIEGMVERDKVTIPQFVAEYIEKSRLKGWDLLASMCFVLNEKNKKTTKWLYLGENKNIFALAWIYGYTVEKEKKYKIVMLNIASSGGVLTRIKHDDSWIWIDTLGTIVEGRTHTRKELEEAGFGWVFDCPGIKIEEVKDE
jgi:phage protein|nr:MAG TPA: Protein of unknown function (DUF1642) [Caudoviricetes sp.]DAN31400.1 MAG TPA: Protein of unknown function (DUF1642) [Caudoviricetes sp.]